MFPCCSSVVQRAVDDHEFFFFEATRFVIMNERHLSANRSMWDERVPTHVDSTFYDVPRFIEGGSHLYPFELEEVGSVEGLSLLHLQCHFGLDTLSWARAGAAVTGLDFSKPAIDAARDIAARCGIDARFEVGEVHDAPEILGRKYDILYTGRGALCWLPDMARWAETASRLVKPGGLLYLSEFHPITDIFSDDELAVENNYFDHGIPFEDHSGCTYTDGDLPRKHVVDFTWTHPVSSVINALLKSGFTLERFEEHEFTAFNRFPGLVHDEKARVYRFPEGEPSIPLMYSTRLRLPA